MFILLSADTTVIVRLLSIRTSGIPCSKIMKSRRWPMFNVPLPLLTLSKSFKKWTPTTVNIHYFITSNAYCYFIIFSEMLVIKVS